MVGKKNVVDNTLKETNFIKNRIGKKILQQYNREVPSGSYISKSRLLWTIASRNLSAIERRSIDAKLRFFDKHLSDYEFVRQNPTRENIKNKHLANCGELADSAMDLFPTDRHLMRAKITVNVPKAKLLEKGISVSNTDGKDTVPLQHVFLMYHDKPNDMLLNVLNLYNPNSFAVDIWRGETKQSANLIMQHLREAGVSEATMTVSFPRNNSDTQYHYYISSDGTIRLLNPPVNPGKNEIAKYLDFRPEKQEKPKEITKKKQKDIIGILYLPNAR